MADLALVAILEAADEDKIHLQVVVFVGLLIVLFLPDAWSLDLNKERFSEPVKLLPIAFVSSIIGGLWAIYTTYHLASRNHTVISWAFNFVTSLLVICYLKCIFIHPGTIPDKEQDPSWIHAPAAGANPFDPAAAEDLKKSGLGVVLHETKRSGDRRSCKWCSKYKPDRCHHCRVCRMCILKMDHHCPWIYNCVGFKNHKYFFLLLFYGTIDCHIIAWTMCHSLSAALDEPSTPFLSMFFLLFGESLTCFVGLLVTAFFTFHIWLMLKSMTTIEFCEKSMKRMGYEMSAYDKGVVANVRAVLGDYMIFWLLPIAPPTGPGLNFVSEESRLLPGDPENGEPTGISAPGMPAPGMPVTKLAAQPKSESSSGLRATSRHSAGTGATPDSPPISDEEDRVSQSGQAPHFQGLARPGVVVAGHSDSDAEQGAAVSDARD